MGKINNSWYTSNTDKWATPKDFFDKLNDEFHFDLDPCAIPDNAKCKRFFTPDDDGLSQDWGGQKYSVTLHMAKILVLGSRNATKKAENLIHWSLCSFLHALTHRISTITSTIRQTKYVLSEVA